MCHVLTVSSQLGQIVSIGQICDVQSCRKYSFRINFTVELKIGSFGKSMKLLELKFRDKTLYQ